jgi:hypothetical protein
VYRPLQQAELEHVTERREAWLSYSAVFSYYPLAGGAVVGGWLLRRRKRLLLPLVGTIACALLGTAMTLGVLRYRASAEPAMAVLAAVAVEAALSRWARRGRAGAS